MVGRLVIRKTLTNHVTALHRYARIGQPGSADVKSESTGVPIDFLIQASLSLIFRLKNSLRLHLLSSELQLQNGNRGAGGLTVVLLIRRSHSAGPFSFDTWIPEAPAVPYTSNLPSKAVDIAWIGVEKFGPITKVGLIVLH